MSERQYHIDELTMGTGIIPALDASIGSWYEARRRCEAEPTKQNQGAYCKAIDELGQAISQWHDEQPQLAEQFKFWFRAHE